MKQTNSQEINAQEVIKSEYLTNMPEEVVTTVLRYWRIAQENLTTQAEVQDIIHGRRIFWEDLHKDPDQATERMIEWFNTHEELRSENCTARKLLTVLKDNSLNFCDGQTMIINTEDTGVQSVYIIIDDLAKNQIEHKRKMKELKEKGQTEQIKSEYLTNIPTEIEKDIKIFIHQLQEIVTDLIEDDEVNIFNEYEIWPEIGNKRYESMSNWLRTNVAPEKEECIAHKLMRVIDLNTIDKCDSVFVYLDEENNSLLCQLDKEALDGLYVNPGIRNLSSIGRFNEDFERWPVLD